MIARVEVAPVAAGFEVVALSAAGEVVFRVVRPRDWQARAFAEKLAAVKLGLREAA